MRCYLCHFEVEPDDVAVGSVAGRVICLRCYERETETGHPMPKWLRQQVSGAAGDVGKDGSV